MYLKDSVIVNTTLTRMFPLAVLFSLYLMSYGAVFPGGGFQGGVILGSMIVITEIALERRLYADNFFRSIEGLGVLILLVFMVIGWFISGIPFGGLYGWSGSSLVFGNVMFWLLGLAIYLEVSGSIVLIVRRFLFWESSPAKLASPPAPQLNRNGERAFRVITAIALGLLGLAALLLLPPLPVIRHSEIDFFRQLTQELGIRNLVTTVYLGPRLMDTVLEVLVVLLTVFGLNAIGETP